MFKCKRENLKVFLQMFAKLCFHIALRHIKSFWLIRTRTIYSRHNLFLLSKNIDRKSKKKVFQYNHRHCIYNMLYALLILNPVEKHLNSRGILKNINKLQRHKYLGTEISQMMRSGRNFTFLKCWLL